MKKLLISFFILFSVQNLSSQDIIILKNTEEISSRIIEITDTHVKYKKYSNLDGPIYNIIKTDVFMIKYENGEKEVFTSNNKPAQNQEQKSNSEQDYSQVKTTIAKSQQSLRRRNFEIGIRPELSVGSLIVRDLSEKSTGFGPSFGGGVFFDKYVKPTSTWLIGSGVNYMHSAYFFDNSEFRFNRMNWDVYFGGRDFTKHIHARAGLRMSFLLNAKNVGIFSQYMMDASSTCNLFTLGYFAEFSYAIKHFDFSFLWVQMFTNILKPEDYTVGSNNSNSGVSSMSWGLGVSISYRFNFKKK